MSKLAKTWALKAIFAGALLLILVAAPAQSATYRWVGPGRLWQDAANWQPNGVPGAGDSATIGPNFSIDLSSDVQVDRLTLGAGTRLTGGGDLSIKSGESVFTDARLSGSGLFRVEEGATLSIRTVGYSYGAIPAVTGTPRISGNVNTRFDRHVLNFGAINWSGGNLLIYKSLNNTANAIIRIRGVGALVRDPVAVSSITNTGTIIKAVSSNLELDDTNDDTRLNLPFNNTGVFTAQTGTLYFYNTFTQRSGETQLKGGSIFSQSEMIYNGGRLNGTGTVQGSVRNNGAVFAPGSSPGMVVINGNYTQTGGGTLQMEIGGVTAGTQYDQLVISGTATLDGTLNIEQFNGFVPVGGNSFQLLKYLVASGNFASVNNLFPSPGFYFTTSKAPSYLVAQTVADATIPTVTMTTPRTDTGYASLPQARGTAADVGSGVAAVTVKLFRYAAAGITAGYWNGTTWDVAYSAANELPATGTTSWNWTVPALAAGKYDLTATARDIAHNSKVGTKTIFWIDTTIPSAVAITSHAANAVVFNLNAVSGTASDAGSGLKRVDFRIKKVSDLTYWNGTGWVASSTTYVSTTLNGGTWSRTNSAGTPMPTGALLPAGSYQLTALAVDKAELKKAVTISITVQAAAPTPAGVSTLEDASQ